VPQQGTGGQPGTAPGRAALHPAAHIDTGGASTQEVVSGPYAAASTALIVEADIAAMAALALLTDELVGQKIPLTGPQALTNAELVDIIGTVVGRRLRYREISSELVREHFTGLGISAEFADAYLAFLSATMEKQALVTREVVKILGRPAESFARWVADHRGCSSMSIGSQ
jgi:uncharacterized protein YbjT (DUF2867 family)